MRRAPLLFACVVLGCGGDESVAPDSGTAADVVVADVADASDTPDVSAPDIAEEDPDEGSPPWTPGPVWDDDVQPLVLGPWMVATYPDGESTSQVRDALDFGFAEVPPTEGVAYGAYWNDVPPGEDGEIAVASVGTIIYAATTVTMEESGWAMVRADRLSDLTVGLRRQPADIYGFGRSRVPMFFEAGDNALFVRGTRRNNVPLVTAQTTRAEVWLNLNDVTAPELDAGSDEPQWLGVPLLVLRDGPLREVTAMVVAGDAFEETRVSLAPLPGGASVQVPFELRPRPGLVASEDGVTVRVRIESPDLEFSYERDLSLVVKEPDADGAWRKTFRSAIDGSVQFYGLRKPTQVVAGEQYALVLSLHGAGVDAKGQAGSYSTKDWAYHVAPTNRRNFGFDWEAFGRLDGLEVLNHAQAIYPIDPTRTYVTGHSMGGHGTWQFGSLFPGRFAVVGPSAGWISFATYPPQSAQPYPTGPFGWSLLSSDTLRFLDNLRDRAVFVVHGTNDQSVPWEQGLTMVQNLEPIVEDLQFHWQEGAGHWWDGDNADGVDCVDWPGLFETMQARTLDPWETDFEFVSASPGVNPTHSFVRLRSAETPAQVMRVVAERQEDTVLITTTNVRSLVLDGEALANLGVTEVVVDGAALEVVAEEIAVGPQTGKRNEVNGPMQQVFHTPFCFAYDEAGPALLRYRASHWASLWNVYGNGTACALPFSEVTDALRATHNMVYLGVDDEHLDLPEGIPFTWGPGTIDVGVASTDIGALSFVFPEGDRLSGVITTTRTHEFLLNRVDPFTSRFNYPDWFVFTDEGGLAAGMFSAEWAQDPALTVP